MKHTRFRPESNAPQPFGQDTGVAISQPTAATAPRLLPSLQPGNWDDDTVSTVSPVRLPKPKLRARVGEVLWIGTLQFFAVEALVQWRWTTPYNRSDYYISDLGALHCADFPDGRFVCSPWHAAMNASFVAQGVLIAGGALLLHPLCADRADRRQATCVTALLVAAGCGVAAVGLAPEDAVRAVHVAGAATNFVAGNAGLVLLGALGRRVPGLRGAATWAGLVGAVGLAALASWGGGAHWGLGVGGIERVIAYPLPAALPVVAIGVLTQRPRGSPRERRR